MSKWVTLRTDLTDVTLVRWVKIPTEDFTGETLAIGDTQLREMMFEVVIGVLLLVMEVDKVSDEVTDMD